jgi:hypothetical protein
MHRDPWIPAEDRTKVFRLFGCSLSPPASGLWPAPDPAAPKGQDWGGAGYWPCPRLAPRRLTGARLRRVAIGPVAYALKSVPLEPGPGHYKNQPLGGQCDGSPNH